MIFITGMMTRSLFFGGRSDEHRPGLLADSEVKNRFVLTKLPSTSMLVLADPRAGRVAAKSSRGMTPDVPILDMNHPLTDGAGYTQPQHITGI